MLLSLSALPYVLASAPQAGFATAVFACSDKSTVTAYTTVTVFDPELVEIRAGCTVQSLRMSCADKLTPRAIVVLVERTAVPGTVELDCAVTGGNITIESANIGCQTMPPANLNPTATPAVPWLPTPTAMAGGQGLSLRGSLYHTTVLIVDSCISSSVAGSEDPFTAPLQAGVALAGVVVEFTNVTVLRSVLAGYGVNESDAAGLAVTATMRSGGITLQTCVVAAATVGIPRVSWVVTPINATHNASAMVVDDQPWPASARGLYALSVGPWWFVDVLDTYLYAVTASTYHARAVDVGVNRAFVVLQQRVIDALADTTTPDGRPGIVSQLLTITNSTLSASTSCGAYAVGRCSTAALRHDGALASRVVLAGPTLAADGAGNTSAVLVTGHTELSSIELYGAKVTATGGPYEGAALVLDGAVTRSAVTVANESALTATVGSGVSKAVSGVAITGASNNATLVVISATVTVTAPATVAAATGLAAQAFARGTLTLLRATVTASGATASSGVAFGAVSRSSVSVESSSIDGATNTFVWQAVDNFTRCILDTNTFTGTNAWVSPLWTPDSTVRFMSRCNTHAAAVYNPPGANLIVACGQCVIDRHCNPAYTLSSTQVNGTCGCDCNETIAATFRVNARCEPLSTYSRELTQSGEEATVTKTISLPRPVSRTRDNTVTDTIEETSSIDVTFTAEATDSFGGTVSQEPSPSRTFSGHRVSPSANISGSLSKSRTKGNFTKSLGSTVSEELNTTVSKSESMELPIPPFMTPFERALHAAGISQSTAQGLEPAADIAGALVGAASAVQANKGVNVVRIARVTQCEHQELRDDPHFLPRVTWAEVGVPFETGRTRLRYVKTALMMPVAYVLAAHAVPVTLLLRRPFWVRARTVSGIVAVVLHLYFLPTVAHYGVFVAARGSDPADVWIGLAAFFGALLVGLFPILALTKMPSVYLAFRMFDRGARDFERAYVRFYLIEDLLVAITIGALTGAAPRLRDSCSGLGIGVGTVCLFHLGYVLFVHPMDRLIVVAFAVLVAAGQVALAAAAVGGTTDDRAVRALGILSMVQVSLIFLQVPVMLWWRCSSSQRKAVKYGAGKRDGEDETLGLFEQELLATVARHGKDPAETAEERRRRKEVERQHKKMEAIEMAVVDDRKKDLHADDGGFTALTFYESSDDEEDAWSADPDKGRETALLRLPMNNSGGSPGRAGSKRSAPAYGNGKHRGMSAAEIAHKFPAMAKTAAMQRRSAPPPPPRPGMPQAMPLRPDVQAFNPLSDRRSPDRPKPPPPPPTPRGASSPSKGGTPSPPRKPSALRPKDPFRVTRSERHAVAAALHARSSGKHSRKESESDEDDDVL